MVTAGNFQFTPTLIHIKLGQHIQLQVASTDKTYGVRLDPFPDGATRSKPIPPGLEFAYGEDCWKIKKGEPAKIVFFAHTAGPYSFTCCKDCAEHNTWSTRIGARSSEGSSSKSSTHSVIKLRPLRTSCSPPDKVSAI